MWPCCSKHTCSGTHALVAPCHDLHASILLTASCVRSFKTNFSHSAKTEQPGAGTAAYQAPECFQGSSAITARAVSASAVSTQSRSNGRPLRLCRWLAGKLGAPHGYGVEGGPSVVWEYRKLPPKAAMHALFAVGVLRSCVSCKHFGKAFWTLVGATPWA